MRRMQIESIDPSGGTVTVTVTDEDSLLADGDVVVVADVPGKIGGELNGRWRVKNISRRSFVLVDAEALYSWKGGPGYVIQDPDPGTGIIEVASMPSAEEARYAAETINLAVAAKLTAEEMKPLADVVDQISKQQKLVLESLYANEIAAAVSARAAQVADAAFAREDAVAKLEAAISVAEVDAAVGKTP